MYNTIQNTDSSVQHYSNSLIINLAAVKIKKKRAAETDVQSLTKFQLPNSIQKIPSAKWF